MVKLSDVLEKKGRDLHEAELDPAYGETTPAQQPKVDAAAPQQQAATSHRPQISQTPEAPAPVREERPLSQEESSRLVSRYQPGSP